MKSGFVNLIGRPNVGKSSILNRLIGRKLSIVSNKPQTTRNSIKFIYTDDRMQIVFLDNPGFQTPKNKLGVYMQELIFRNSKDADINIYVMDHSLENGRLDNEVLNFAKTDNSQKMLLVNKSDLLSEAEKEELKSKYELFQDFSKVVFLSAETGDGFEKFKDSIYDLLDEGPMFYDEEDITDSLTREIMEEILREKCLMYLDEEIPHGIYVATDEFVESEDRVEIRLILYLERESHKSIVIGKDGKMIKRIISSARRDMEIFLEKKVKLKVDIKIRKNWRKNDSFVKRWF